MVLSSLEVHLGLNADWSCVRDEGFMSWNFRDSTEYETGTLTIIVINSRALIRDCLANSLRTMNEGWVIRTFASIDEWHSVQSNLRPR